jgi:hypothetical protein
MAIPQVASVEAIRQINDRRPDKPQARTGGPKALALAIRIGCCLIAKHYDHEGQRTEDCEAIG